MNKKSFLIVLLTIIFINTTVFSQTDIQKETEKLETKKIPIDPNVKIGKLSNGLTPAI